MHRELIVQPLAGIRVLDMSWHGPGSIAAWLLVELGADVIKVEPPDGSDFVRSFGPRVDGVTVAQLAFDRGKRSLAIDLRQRAGAAAVLEVAAGCDAVIDGFRPGVANRLGVGPDAVRARNQAVSFCQVTGFGAGGPSAGRAGHDLNYVAEAGLFGLLPQARPAAPLPAQVADYVTAPMAALAVLAGVLQARVTGVGADIEASLIDSAMFAAVLPLAEQLMLGASPGAGGHLLAGGLACYDVYPCADGALLTVAALEPAFWRRFCEITELDPACADDHLRPERQASLRAAVAARLATRPRAEWLAAFDGQDACVAPVLRLAEALNSPDVASRHRVRPAAVPGSDRVVHAPSGPLVVAGDDPPLRRPPMLGEHTRQVLVQAGVGDDQIEALLASRIAVDQGSLACPLPGQRAANHPVACASTSGSP